MTRKSIKKNKFGMKPDCKYNSMLVSRVINMIMREGKKSAAMKIVYDAMATLEKKTQKGALEVLEKVIEKARPLVEVKSRRIGGANYQIPIEIDKARSETLALRWMIGYAKKRGAHSMADKLSGEMLDILEDKGATIKKKEDTHKMAEANKAFAHYNW